MIFVVTLPGVSLANVAYKWLVAGMWGSALTVGITDTSENYTFVIDAVPPDGSQEIKAYDVTDPTNFNHGNYLSRIGGASVDDIAARIITDHGAGSYVATGAGSGAYLVTVTVKDEDDNPLQNATVRLTEGINVRTLLTDENGITSPGFNVNTATYAIGITKDGYQFTPSTIEVTGDGNFDEEMTLVVLPIPIDPEQSIGYLTTYDDFVTPQPGVTITFRILEGPGSGSYLDHLAGVTSDENALLTATFFRGSKYEARRGKGEWVEFTVPDSDNFALPEVLGRPIGIKP